MHWRFAMPPPPAGCRRLGAWTCWWWRASIPATNMRRGWCASCGPSIRTGAVAALGGPQLAAAGAQLLHDLTASSVVGLVEVLRNYSFFKALFAETLRWIGEHRPRAVCFVDSRAQPAARGGVARARDFREGRRRDRGLLYYISPQIWAWKAGRRFTMARDLDALAVIFPFEVECYADTRCRWNLSGIPSRAGLPPPVRYDPAGPVLLLPGSRRQAVARIFPVLLAGFRRPAAGGGGAVSE
jgi:lipid-A-disaccharide synthase